MHDFGDCCISNHLHYATNNLDYEVSTGDAIKTILNNQASQHITLVKVAGATARTEDFIKTLLKREDYQVSPGKVDSDVVGIDDEIMEHADEERLSQAMLILEKFFPWQRMPLISMASRLCKSVYPKMNTCDIKTDTRNYVRHRLCR